VTSIFMALEIASGNLPDIARGTAAGCCVTSIFMALEISQRQLAGDRPRYRCRAVVTSIFMALEISQRHPGPELSGALPPCRRSPAASCR